MEMDHGAYSVFLVQDKSVNLLIGSSYLAS